MIKKKNSTLLTKKYYENIIIEDLIVKDNYKNIMEIPRIKKIVLNISSKQPSNDKKNLLPIFFALELISNQKINYTKAKKSIATFKLRKNQTIGAKVTLRAFNKTFFLEKLIKIVLPRLYEYQGTSHCSFNEKGNVSFGLRTLLVFPELENFFQYFEKIGGIDISLEITKKKKEKALLLVSSYQLPIKDI